MAELRYDNQVVVVTGAGAGLGRAYALFFASRGAMVVVNDLGGTIKGEGKSSKAADVVTNEIKSAGGKAVANYDSVEHGDKIVQTAIDQFGRIDVLINNAGILRDVSFGKMTDTDWDTIMKVHVTGPYKCARAAWPYFRKQKYGRIINTCSDAGLFGNYGQANYSAAKMAQVGFSESLAKEGLKYNIIVNVIAPVAASRLTATVLPPQILEKLKPEWVVPLVAVLAHSLNTSETGSIFQVGGGYMAKLRWERSEGVLVNPDKKFTPGTVLENWSKIMDYSKNSQYPTDPANAMNLLTRAQSLPSNKETEQLDFRGKVVLVTGGGAGLGREYCIQFARLGAKVVVNDLVNAETVVQEIKRAHGTAVGVKTSAEEGEKLIQACIDTFGRIDIVINNAGILRDKSFANMTDQLWDPIMRIHLRATYKVTKAAWPYMVKQKYGRIINTTSTTGIYGNFGQSNYAAAKAGVIGFSKTLAIEGRKHNIYVNIIAPNAGTALTRTVMPEDVVRALKTEYVAPLVLALCSDKVPTPTGGLYEVGSGWIASTSLQRSGGHNFPLNIPFTPESVWKSFSKIIDFSDDRADKPTSPQDTIKKIMKSTNTTDAATNSSLDSNAKASFIRNIDAAKKADAAVSMFTYANRDSIIYNLGLGAKGEELTLVYEAQKDFQVLPTFGTVPLYFAKAAYNMEDLLPNFNPNKLLHGEQYLEIMQYPIPTHATLRLEQRLLEVIDKGNAAVIKSGITSIDTATGKHVFYSESSLFVRGSGGFGGPRISQDRGTATAENKAPSRRPDFIREEKTGKDQAVLYRLSGDLNPLHIDPAFAAKGGFKSPILHGLCFFGVSGKHVFQQYGRFKNLKVRFAGTVLPGQTLVTEMWKEKNKVLYQCRVKETGKLCISNAAAELLDGVNHSSL